MGVAQPMRLVLHLQCQFSSTVQWISPLQLLEPPSRPPDPPPISLLQEPAKKVKFITHNTAINMIKREKDPQKSLKIFNMLASQKGFSHNHSTYAVILHKLASFKKFKAVDAVLHKMTFEACKFHEGLFLNLMHHFSKSSLHEKTLEMFFSIPPFVRQKPSMKALSTCLNLLIESAQVDLAKKLLFEARSRLGILPNACIYNILIKHHCMNGDIASAFAVFEKMKKGGSSTPNLVTYSTLIGGLCAEAKLHEAVELLDMMISDNIFPDALTYNLLIHGFCESGKVESARKILGFMRRNGCMPNLFNYSTLMSGYSKHGQINDAEEVFDEMLKCGIKADTVTYTILVDALSRAGMVDEGIKLLNEMSEKECRPDVVTFNAVLKGLCMEKRFVEATLMLEKLHYQAVYLNKASYRIVLNLLCAERDMDKVMGVLGLMLEKGFLPHFATSNEVLISLCDDGRVVDASVALHGLTDLGFQPELDSWARLVEAVSRERKLIKVFDLLDELTVTVE